MKPLGYADLATLPEDDRIALIGRMVTEQKKVIGITLEDDKAKIQRYCSKLLTRFPQLVIVSQLPGLVPRTVFVKVGPKPENPISQ